MSIKLLAMGNVLMKDDGIAIYLADEMHDSLLEAGIEVIYGETDIGYCVTQVKDGDYIILMDAARFGTSPGDITVLPFHEIETDRRHITHHCISFLDLLKLYYPGIDGFLITIEIAEIDFSYGPSPLLSNRLTAISQELLKRIMDMVKNLKSNFDRQVSADG